MSKKQKKIKAAAKNSKQPAVHKLAAKKSAAPAKAPRRHISSWLDDESGKPVIDRYAKKLGGFLEAMADGKIDLHEVEAQERRVVKLMREIEPALSPEMHAQVTRLLCELTAYDLMQTLYGLEQSRPKTQFVG